MKPITTISLCILLASCGHQAPPNVPISAPPDAATNTASQKHVDITDLSNGFRGTGGADEYAIYIDSVEQFNEHSVFTMKALNPKKYGAISRVIHPPDWGGKRIKYTGWIRTKDASWAALWLKVDTSSSGHHPANILDAMLKKQVTGTTGWQKCELVADVPPGAVNIIYGALLRGGGQLWCDSMQVQIVDKHTAVTKQPVSATHTHK